MTTSSSFEEKRDKAIIEYHRFILNHFGERLRPQYTKEQYAALQSIIAPYLKELEAKIAWLRERYKQKGKEEVENT